jgi:hypothetical protein
VAFEVPFSVRSNSRKANSAKGGRVDIKLSSN